MATSKEILGPTTHGGVKSIIYYLNSERELVDESEATYADIVEYDSGGKQVFRVYGKLGSGEGQ